MRSVKASIITIFILVGYSCFTMGGVLFKPDNSWIMFLGMVVTALLIFIGVSATLREFRAQDNEANRIIGKLKEKSPK